MKIETKGIREKVSNIKTALVLRSVLERGVASTHDISEALVKEGWKWRSALNAAFTTAEELVKLGMLERVGVGRPARYKLTLSGALFLLLSVRNGVTKIIEEDLVLNYIEKEEPSLHIYIEGYRALRHLLPKREEEEEREEDIYGLLKWSVEEGLWEDVDVKSWEDLLDVILDPIVDLILEEDVSIPSQLPESASATLRKAVELARKKLEEEEEELREKKRRIAKIESLLSQ